jgi:hypothetical protein
MDTETEAQINDQLLQMTDLLSQQNSAMASQIKMMTSAAESFKQQSLTSNNASISERQFTSSVSGNSKKVEAATKAMQMYEDANKNFSEGVNDGVESFKGFSRAMLDVTPGLAKYSESVKGATLALAGFSSGFGLIGKSATLILGVFSKLVSASFNYNDAVVKGYDDVAKLGGAIGSNAEEILRLGHEAGLSSQNLELFTRNATSLGSNIKALGNTTSDGVKSLGKVFAVGDTTLQQYRKLGITQDRLMEMQTKYIDVQAKSGADLKKSPKEIQKESLKYINSLNVMAEVTGISADKQQDLLDQAMQQENFNAHIADINAKIAATKDPVEKKKLENILNATEAAGKTAMMYGPKQGGKMLELLSTNGEMVLTERTAGLAAANPKLAEIVHKMNQGQDVQADLISSQSEATEKFRKTMGGLDQSFGGTSREIQDIFGQSNEARQMNARFRGKSADDIRKMMADAEKQQNIQKNQNSGDMANRAKLESEERKARLAFDDILGKTSASLNKMLLKVMPYVNDALKFLANHLDIAGKVFKGLAVALGILAGVAGIGKIIGIFRSFHENLTSIFKGKQELGSHGKPMHVRLIDSSNNGSAAPKLINELEDKVKSGKGKKGAISALGGALEDKVKSGKGKKGAISALGGELEGKGKKGGIAGALEKLTGPATKSIAPLEKMANAPGSDMLGTFLQGLAKGLAAFGAAAPEIIIGSGAIGLAITAIGAGLAAGGALVGSTLPIVAEGLHSFDKINGENLKNIGMGMAGLGAGILAMGGSKVVDAFTSIGNLFSSKKTEQDDPIDKLGKQLLKFQNLNVKADKIKYNANAFMEFSIAFSKATAASASGTVISGIANGVSSFFSSEPPFAKFVSFSELKIDPKRTQQNAIAFKYFSEAMSSYHGSGPLGSLGTIATALADSTVKFFGVKPPVDQFNYFANLNIDPKKAKDNAIAFTSFANALADYKGGPGLIDAISSLAGGVFDKFMGKDGPIEAFDKFTRMNFGPNMEKNSSAFEKYANSITKVGGGGTSGGPSNGNIPPGGTKDNGGNQPNSFMGSVASGMHSGAALGAGAIGAIGGAAAATASGIGSLASSAWNYITGNGAEKGVKPEVLARKQQLEKIVGKKLIVTSGVRQGVANHEDGSAIDIGLNTNRLSEDDKVKIITNAINLGFTGIGAEYAASGGAHIHLDTSHKSLTAWGSDYHHDSLKKDAPWLLGYLNNLNSKKTMGEHGGPPTTSGDAGKMVSTIKKDSVIAKLGKKSQNQNTKTNKITKHNENQNTKTDNTTQVFDIMYTRNMILNEKIASKLDQVIGILESDHDTQHKILREVRL